MGSDCGLDAFVSAGVLVLEFEFTQLHELSSSIDERFEFLQEFRGFLGDSWVDGLGITDDDVGIDAICFGQDSEGVGELTNASGIEDGDLVFCVGEFSDEGLMIDAGGLDGDEA